MAAASRRAWVRSASTSCLIRSRSRLEASARSRPSRIRRARSSSVRVTGPQRNLRSSQYRIRNWMIETRIQYGSTTSAKGFSSAASGAKSNLGPDPRPEQDAEHERQDAEAFGERRAQDHVRSDKTCSVGIAADRLTRLRGDHADAKTRTKYAKADGNTGGETSKFHLDGSCLSNNSHAIGARPLVERGAARGTRRYRCRCDSLPRVPRHVTRWRGRST